MVKYIETITSNVDSAAKSSLLNFPLPMAIINYKGELSWFNEKFGNIFDGENTFMFEKQILELFPTINLKTIIDGTVLQPLNVEYDNRHFNIYVSTVTASKKSNSNSLITMYFFECTDYVKLRTELANKKSAVGIIMIDNYDEIMVGAKEVERANAIAKIDEIITNWVGSPGGITQKYDRDKYIFIVEEKFLENVINEKFPILESAKACVVGTNNMPITLSLGVGRDFNTFSEKFDAAKVSIDMALGRGGDQVVVRNKNGFEYFGGKSKGVEKRTKVRSRVVATAMRELISMSGNVLIMGHKYADYDSLGASVGIYRACFNLGVPANIIIDTKASMVKKMIDRFLEKEEYEGVFIHPDDADQWVLPKTLLVIVDSHRDDYCEIPGIIPKFKHIVVIDHHRRSERFIDNATLLFHEPFASSTSEMVSEILQYLGENGKINSDEAEALLCGIMLDTKNFTFKTGVRTFEAAAFLRKSGADTIEAKRFFSSEIAHYKIKSKLVMSAQMYAENMAISWYTNKELPIPIAKEIMVSAADELVAIDNVKASFVIGEFNGSSHISARSLGEVNVHVILEKLGGGGHQTMAGVQIKDKGIEEATELLKSAIDEYLKS